MTERKNHKKRHNRCMSTVTISLSDTERNVLKDSLSSEKLNFTEDANKNPELKEYLNLLEGIEKKLN